MALKHSQQGMSSGALLLLLVVAGFFLLCAFKLIPVYAENYYITAGLKELGANEQTLSNMSKADVIRQMNKYYTLNNVRSEGSKKLKVIRDSNGIIVDNQYETRVHLLANIDVVMTFHNVLDSRHVDDCCSAPKEK